MQEQLEYWGIKVTTANSGQTAIKACEKQLLQNQNLFDIALIDMQMPVMHGLELGMLIKQDKRLKDMHLVLMTSMLMDKDNQQIYDHGFSGYFTKPVTNADLFLALNVLGENGEALQKADSLITHDYLSCLEVDENLLVPDLKEEIAKLTNKHVLLVEDNAINIMVASDMLEDLGLTITCAENGVDALTKLNQKTDCPFCMIFMDCQMPKMDGYTTTREIRAGKAGRIHQDTPIAALTANNMKGDQQKCLDAGMNDFISKPIEQEQLERVIRSWLLAKF